MKMILPRLEEIRFGDNDKLSAMIANALSAELLILLSDVNGLYTANPKKSLQAKLITSVEEVDQQIEKYIDKDLSEFRLWWDVGKNQCCKTLYSIRIHHDHIKWFGE